MSATTDTILAIDLGRYKSVACIYARATREHSFRTLNTTPAQLNKLLARHPGALVVIEACANAGCCPGEGNKSIVHEGPVHVSSKLGLGA